jgi:hypothetical protein
MTDQQPGAGQAGEQCARGDGPSAKRREMNVGKAHARDAKRQAVQL